MSPSINPDKKLNVETQTEVNDKEKNPNESLQNIPSEDKPFSCNQDLDIVPFNPESNMNVQKWLKYLNQTCEQNNLDENFKVKNITKFLKGSALTHFINNGLELITFDEISLILTERFQTPEILNFSDFAKETLDHSGNVVDYFHKKVELGKKLNLNSQIILEGLTEGLPVNIKQLVSINNPKNPTEWLNITLKLLKMQEPAKRDRKSVV